MVGAQRQYGVQSHFHVKPNLGYELRLSWDFDSFEPLGSNEKHL